MYFSTTALLALAVQTSTTYAQQAAACSNSKHSSYVSILATYSPAQAYCTSNYPFAKGTSTVTVTATRAAGKKRQTKPTKAPKVYSQFTTQPASIQKTVCRCIETAATTTVTVQPTPSCSSGAYTDPATQDEFEVYCGSDAIPADTSNSYPWNNDDGSFYFEDVYACVRSVDQYYVDSNYVACGVIYDRSTGDCRLIGRVGQPLRCRSDPTAGAADPGTDLALHDDVGK